MQDRLLTKGGGCNGMCHSAEIGYVSSNPDWGLASTASSSVQTSLLPPSPPSTCVLPSYLLCATCGGGHKKFQQKMNKEGRREGLSQKLLLSWIIEFQSYFWIALLIIVSTDLLFSSVRLWYFPRFRVSSFYEYLRICRYKQPDAQTYV